MRPLRELSLPELRARTSLKWSAYGPDVLPLWVAEMDAPLAPAVTRVLQDVAASGGYWIAMGADEIWAYPNTITGSIGIFGFFPTFQDTLDIVGINTDGFGTTPIAGGFRADRELPQADRAGPVRDRGSRQHPQQLGLPVDPAVLGRLNRHGPPGLPGPLPFPSSA